MFITRNILMQQAGAAGGSPAPVVPPAPVVAPQGAPPPPAQAPQQPSTVQPTDPQKPPVADPAKPVAPSPIVIKLPDGTKADPKFVESFTAAATKRGLSQEQAQGMAEFLIETQASGSKALESALQQHVAKEQEALRNDKEFGGPNTDKTLKASENAMKSFFEGDFVTRAQKDGVISVHDPAFLKGLARIRSLISEDSVGDKGERPGATMDTREAELRRMFPNSYDQMAGKK